MDYLEKKIKENKPNIKQSTLNAYLQNIKRTYILLKVEIDKNNLILLENKKEITKLFSNRKYTTMRNIYNAIIVSLQSIDGDKQVIDEYVKDRDEFNDLYKNWVVLNEKSPTQKLNWISMKEINLILEYTKTFDRQKHLLLSLFLKYPARNSFRNLQIITYSRYKKKSEAEKIESNYFIKTQKPTRYWFSLGNYKTSGTYGVKLISIDKSFNKDIGAYLRKTKKTSYLFTNDDNAPFTTNEFTKYFNNIFKSTGKNISTSLLRHIIVSEEFGDSKKKQEELASNSGHSLKTSNDYIKYD